MILLPHEAHDFISGHLFGIDLVLDHKFLNLSICQLCACVVSVKVARICILVCLSVINLSQKPLFKHLRILRIIHFLNDSSPHPLFNNALLDLVKHFVDIIFTLEWVLIFQKNFQKIVECVFYMHLDESKLLITLIFKDFTEKSYLVICRIMELYTINQGSSPLDYESLKAILLVQISIHVLLHSLSSHPRILTLFVKLDLL